MSTTEEKATDSAAAPANPEGEQPATATAGQGAESSDTKEESASDAKEESAASEKATEASAEAADEAAKPSSDDAVSADSEGGEVLEIEVEAEEEPVDPIAELNAKVAELESGKKANYDRFLRASADLENFRKRSRRDVKDARLDERGKVLRDMLPVIDNLDRAVKHAEETNNEATKSIVEGVNLVLRQFSQALERHNVTSLDAVGKPFDPALHEAVSQAPSADHPPGTIISALQAGYMMDGRLLRPSLVVVSVAMPAEEPAKEEAPEEKAEEAKAAAADVIDVESEEAPASGEASSDDSASVEAASDATANDTSDKSASASDEESSAAEASESSEKEKGAEAAADAEPSKAEAQDKE